MSRSLDLDTPFFATDHAHDGLAWETHLTTLFPEVRPRGHFEVRSCDAIDPMYYAAPLVLLTGLAYDPQSAREASLLAGDSRVLLRTAGEQGLRDPAMARTARDLFELALAGVSRLGPDFCEARDLDTARAFFADFTARDRSPADDRASGHSHSSEASTRVLTK
jgi:glutamate--cysteine ligase